MVIPPKRTPPGKTNPLNSPPKSSLELRSGRILSSKYTPKFPRPKFDDQVNPKKAADPKDPQMSNHPKNTGAIKKTPRLNPNTDPFCEKTRSRQEEAARVNEALSSLNPSRSMDDLYSGRDDRLNFPPLRPHRPDMSLNQLGAYSLPPSSELLDEIAMLKAKIQEMSMKSKQPSNVSHSPIPPDSRTGSKRSSEATIPRKSVEVPNNDSEESESEEEEIVEDRRRGHIRGNGYQHFRCEMDKWPIRFNGTGVQKFIKKLNRLQKSYGYSDETVAKYFHLLVEGKAASWFWIYCDEFEDIDLNHMKVEMGRVFKSEETDMSLMTRMYERKQGSDSFETFFYDILELNFSMKTPLTDPQIIEILRTNMDDEVRQRIFTYETKDRTKYFHKANRAYKDVVKAREKKKESFGNLRGRRINEIDFEDLSTLEIEEISSKLNNLRTKRANMTCFNCHSPDHLLRECPEEISRFFCFRCGLEGYATPKCPKCSLNPQRSAENNRTPRSQ